MTEEEYFKYFESMGLARTGDLLGFFASALERFSVSDLETFVSEVNGLRTIFDAIIDPPARLIPLHGLINQAIAILQLMAGRVEMYLNTNDRESLAGIYADVRRLEELAQEVDAEGSRLWDGYRAGAVGK